MTACDITGTIQHSSRDPDYTTKQATEKIKIIRSGRGGKSVLICRWYNQLHRKPGKLLGITKKGLQNWWKQSHPEYIICTNKNRNKKVESKEECTCSLLKNCNEIPEIFSNFWLSAFLKVF